VNVQVAKVFFRFGRSWGTQTCVILVLVCFGLVLVVILVLVCFGFSFGLVVMLVLVQV
jgi:hypothetical protein